jgi:transcriptional regulator with XRE-family HTH domain
MIAEKIKMLRNARGYSQEYMAAKLSIDQTKYSRIEKGEVKPTNDQQIKIAEEFGVSIADLNSNAPFVIYNMESNQGTQISYNENLHQAEKVLYELLLKDIHKQIESLENQNKTKDEQIATLLNLVGKHSI